MFQCCSWSPGRHKDPGSSLTFVFHSAPRDNSDSLSESTTVPFIKISSRKNIELDSRHASKFATTTTSNRTHSKKNLHAGLACCYVGGGQHLVRTWDCRVNVQKNTVHCEHPGVTRQQSHRCHQPGTHRGLLTLLVFALEISSSQLWQL